MSSSLCQSPSEAKPSASWLAASGLHLGQRRPVRCHTKAVLRQGLVAKPTGPSPIRGQPGRPNPRQQSRPSPGLDQARKDPSKCCDPIRWLLEGVRAAQIGPSRRQLNMGVVNSMTPVDGNGKRVYFIESVNTLWRVCLTEFLHTARAVSLTYA